jgi:hypothetical protein
MRATDPDLVHADLHRLGFAPVAHLRFISGLVRLLVTDLSAFIMLPNW